LQDLHNGIINNIASLKSQLAQTLKNQSGVYMENTALNDVKIISIDGKQITPADILSEFKDVEQDVIFPIIQELLQNNHRTILKINGGDYVRSHVEKIGNDQVIVINQNDFAKGVTKEQKLYTLLNLLIDSEISGLPTQSKRLGHIIRKWLQIKGPSGTLTQMLKLREVHETMKKSVLLKQYYHALLEDATSLELKQIARSNLVSCQRALLYRDVYYYDLLESDKSPAQIGDIYVEETPVGNIEYVFLGKTKDNICIFAPITNGVAEIKLTYEMSTSKSFKRI
jgi:hypothetical protein